MDISNVKQIYFCTFTQEDTKNQVLQKYNLKPYNNINEPAIFLGCNYEKDREVIRKHNSEGYIYFYNEQLNGNRKTKNIRNNNFINEIKNSPHLSGYLIKDYNDTNAKILFKGIKTNIITQSIVSNDLTISSNGYYKYDFSIVMSYYNRKEQTLETLNGFERLYAGKYNFQVVIVDDNSNQENKLDENIRNFNYPINLIQISEEEKGERINPCIAYNKGFQNAEGRIIIIQNPECYHVGDILDYTRNNLTEQDYFTYSCFNTNNINSNKIFLESSNKFNLIYDKEFLSQNFDYNEKSMDLSWYNHLTINPTKYHYCSAIFKSKLDLIGGFDKKFANGYCFDDDDFLLSIKYNLKLNITIIPPTNCFILHQYHKRNTAFKITEKDNDLIRKKWEYNKKLFEDKKREYEKNNFNYTK